jgi:hypothetical protein
MNNKIYISCPQSINWNIFLKSIEKYTDLKPYFWTRHTYDASSLNNADLFVLVLPDFDWSCNTEFLPAGCYKELNYAIDTSKKLHILYKSKDGNNNYNIYEAEIFNTSGGKKVIQGIPGTSNSIVKYCNNNSNEFPMPQVHTEKLTVEEIITRYGTSLSEDQKVTLINFDKKRVNKTFNRKILLLNG